MTNSGLQHVRIEGTQARIRKLLKDLDDRATQVIRDTKKAIYVSVPGSELRWLDKVTKDMGCKKAEVPELPKFEKALCGTLTTDRPHHELRCKACAVLRSTEPKKVRRPAGTRKARQTVVAKIEPGQNFDLNGVIASIELTRDRLYEQLCSLEDLLKSLTGYRDARDKMTGLEQEAKDRMDAARKLLSENKV